MSNAIALDLGSSEFRSIRQDGQRLIARHVPAIYCVAEDNASNRRLLEQAHLPYSKAKSSLVILGDAANAYSTLVRSPVVPLITNGQLPWNDPVGRQICSTLIESLIPPTSTYSLCAMTVPAASVRQLDNQATFLKQLISLRGYQLTLVNPATALSFAELSDKQFTGVNLAIGADSISVSITHLGAPIFENTYCQGFRSLESKFAQSRHRYLWDQNGNRYLDMPSIHNWIRESNLSLVTPRSGDEFWLAKEFSQLLSAAWSSMLPELMRLKTHPVLKNRLRLAVSGAPTHLDGFSQLLDAVLEKSCLPFKVEQIQQTSLDPFAVARGLLVHAKLLASQPQKLDHVA